MIMAFMLVTFVIVAFVFVVRRSLDRFRLGVVFEGVGAGTQRFAFQALSERAETDCDFGFATSVFRPRGCVSGSRSRVTGPFGLGIPPLMVRGFAHMVKPAERQFSTGSQERDHFSYGERNLRITAPADLSRFRGANPPGADVPAKVDAVENRVKSRLGWTERLPRAERALPLRHKG